MNKCLAPAMLLLALSSWAEELPDISSVAPDLVVPEMTGESGQAAFVLVLMLGTFLLWGGTAYLARRRGASVAASCVAAIWSAMVCMTLAVGFGVLLNLYVSPIPLSELAEWVEFRRTGWADLQAFSIATTLEDATTHMMIGPVVATLFGLGGVAIAALKLQRTHD